MRDTLIRVGRGLRWYLRQATGEAKWDEHVEHCRLRGVDPGSRRDFERRRADERDRDPQSRCC